MYYRRVCLFYQLHASCIARGIISSCVPADASEKESLSHSIYIRVCASGPPRIMVLGRTSEALCVWESMMCTVSSTASVWSCTSATHALVGGFWASHLALPGALRGSISCRVLPKLLFHVVAPPPLASYELPSFFHCTPIPN